MLKRTLLHGLILIYLFLSASALIDVLFGVRMPFVHPTVLRYFHGMMGPYKGYSEVNEELHAEGLLADGLWVDIDLHPYIPFQKGEFNVRGYLMTVHSVFGDEAAEARFAIFARELHQLEKERGREYQTVRLTWETWPVSPDGFYTLKLPPFTEQRILATYP